MSHSIVSTLASHSTAQQELRLSISGMRCEGCVEHIRQALRSLEGVVDVTVSLSPPVAMVKTQRPLPLTEINQALAKVGSYHASECAADELAVPMFHLALPTLNVPAAPRASAPEFWQDNITWKRASLNTLNCLIGCSIGDFGFIIYAQATALAWSMWLIMGIAMLCGLSTSVMMETLLLKWREKFSWRAALHTALSMSFLSMLAMELAENVTDYLLTGGTAMPHEPFFWFALSVSLLAGFLVPLPYNYFKLRKYNKACH
ncbi:MAG: hypothetical protein CMR00_05670 [[Chlorobium] sp. 445]|nr:MAG: hypothetical protein CMR00_05670 [[Chlorobium] sp. 445]